MASLTNLTIQSSAKIATGNSLQRTAASSGRVRQNSTHGVIEFAGTAWDSSKTPEGIITRGLTVNINGYDTKSYTGSGLTVINSASPGNDATLTSGQVYTPSDPGYFSFNGSTYSTSVPHSSLTSFAGDMTLSCWIYISAYPAGDWVRIVGKGLSAVRNYGLWYHSSGWWLWQRHGTVGLSLQYNGTTLPTQWVQMVGVSRGTTHELYLNGVMVASSTVSSTFNTNTEPLLIGRMADLHSVHNGFVSSVLVYNRGLSAREVLYNYNQQAGRHFKSTITPSNAISGSYIGSVEAGTGTTFTPTMNFGEADSTRRVVIALSWNAQTTDRWVNSATIGGVSATVVQSTATNGSWERSAIIYASVPTGTSGTVSVTFNGAISGQLSMSSFRVVGGAGTAGPSGTVVYQGASTSYALTQSYNAGDYIIASAGTGGPGVGMTWTNATQVYANTSTYSGSHAATSAATSGNLTITAAAPSSYGVLTIASFR